MRAPVRVRPPLRYRRARMHIRDWPESERPREKLLRRGPNTLSDAELLALFLGYGLRGSDAVACARRLHQAVLPRFVRLWRQPPQAEEPAVPEQQPEAAAPSGLAGLWQKLVSKVADAAEEATTVAAQSSLTPEQQARLERARLRPWDDERVLEQLNRIADLRLALQAALSA